jgi:hypothetical protein
VVLNYGAARAVGRAGGGFEQTRHRRRPWNAGGDTPMTNFFLFRWFRDVPIAKKLYFTVGIMALLISLKLFALFFSLSTLSSLRAYVGGEGLWSKAQKDAVFHLYKYGVSRNQEDYVLFRAFMRVPVGDGRTRRELEKETPDMDVARQGFLEGRNHPDDVDGMIKLFRNFKNIYYIEKAILIWGEAEPLALQRLRSAINFTNSSLIRLHLSKKSTNFSIPSARSIRN